MQYYCYSDDDGNHDDDNDDNLAGDVRQVGWKELQLDGGCIYII